MGRTPQIIVVVRSNRIVRCEEKLRVGCSKGKQVGHYQSTARPALRKSHASTNRRVILTLIRRAWIQTDECHQWQGGIPDAVQRVAKGSGAIEAGAFFHGVKSGLAWADMLVRGRRSHILCERSPDRDPGGSQKSWSETASTKTVDSAEQIRRQTRLCFGPELVPPVATVIGKAAGFGFTVSVVVRQTIP